MTIGFVLGMGDMERGKQSDFLLSRNHSLSVIIFFYYSSSFKSKETCISSN